MLEFSCYVSRTLLTCPTQKGDCKADLATRAHFCGNIIATKSPAGNVQEGLNFAEVEKRSRKNEGLQKYLIAKQIRKYKNIKKVQQYKITNMTSGLQEEQGQNRRKKEENHKLPVVAFRE